MGESESGTGGGQNQVVQAARANKFKGENQREKAEVQTVESGHEQKGLGERVVEERRESETRIRERTAQDC